MGSCRLSSVIAYLGCLSLGVAFTPNFPLRGPTSTVGPSSAAALWAAEGKKKRRRRKQAPSAPLDPKQEQELDSLGEPKTDEFSGDIFEERVGDGEEIDVSLIKDVAKFQFEGEKTKVETKDQAPSEAENLAIPLPDIKDQLRRKEVEAELARIEEEEAASRPRIKRTDIDALKKLLEQQPYADADDSFFEEEEYGTVSALLGERALPFLGIPTGPLQVGHFIGALVIVLMAFVEYPGFPLTNLPTPLRGALQGGLFAVYSINAVLAVLAVFKARERGQPAGLWVAKTLTVGGIAFDQLTQLPTLEKIEEIKSRKGKRALKNRKK